MNRLDIKGVAIVLFVAAILAIGIYAAAKEQQAKRECISDGGVVNEYNCHATTHCGSNGGMCTTTNHCDWQCVR